MEFSFNTFFGYENQINSLKDQVLLYGFAGIIFTILGLIFLAVLLRKLGLNSVNSFFVNPLMLALGLTLLVNPLLLLDPHLHSESESLLSLSLLSAYLRFLFFLTLFLSAFLNFLLFALSFSVSAKS